MGETQRRRNNRERALEALRRAGAQGVTNVELCRAAGMRAGARVFELRRDGYDIASTDLGEGRWRYTLVSEPPSYERAVPAVHVPTQEGRLF